MIFRFFFVLSVALVLLSGCASYNLRGHIMSGREALIDGRSWQALNRFQRAARLNPHYVTDFTEFEEGIWTYVGRAHYQMGELENARGALKRAVREHPDDLLARLYLGLVLIRQRSPQEGLKEARAGLRLLKSWLRGMERYDDSGVYWDPGQSLENEIDLLLASIEGGDVSWRRIAFGLERLGSEFEEEIDRAREDELLDQQEDDDNGDGPS